MNELSAAEVVAMLGLAPHPEGGFYRETYRDSVLTTATGRAASTAIYFLIPAGVVSRWHRIDAAEVWHWYAGAPLELSISPDDATAPATLQLGADLAAGQRPQGIVPPHHWQQAQSLGDWTLVGCTVAPAFEFARFVMARDGFTPGGAAG